MEMKSMKLTPAQKKNMIEGGAPLKEEYPYGLRVSLHDEQISKVLAGMPQVGQKLMLHAMVEVCGVSQYEHAERKSRSVDLQITDMALAPAESKQSTEETLYGG